MRWMTEIRVRTLIQLAYKTCFFDINKDINPQLLVYENSSNDVHQKSTIKSLKIQLQMTQFQIIIKIKLSQ